MNKTSDCVTSEFHNSSLFYVAFLEWKRYTVDKQYRVYSLV